MMKMWSVTEHTRKSKKGMWLKKNGNSLFKITYEKFWWSWNLQAWMLRNESNMSEKESIGLYRKDGIAKVNS